MERQTISAMELRQRAGDVMNRVHYKGERLVVNRDGTPMMALVSVEDLACLEQLERQRDAELLYMAKATSRGVVPVEALLRQHEELHGERLGFPGQVEVG